MSTENTDNKNQEKTFTQDQVNAIIAERVARVKANYSDYEDIAAKAKKFDEQEEAAKSDLQKATDEVAKLTAQVKKYEHEKTVSDIRTKVSNDTGVPVNLLTADTEEACKAQAAAIAAYAKSGSYPKVKDGGEANHNDDKKSTRDAFADWFNESLK